jgi:hypothetical protein
MVNRKTLHIFLSKNPSLKINAKIKLAKLFTMNDDEILNELNNIEKDPLFIKLKKLGVIKISTSKKFIEATKKFEGVYLRSSSSHTPEELLDANSTTVEVIRKIGEEKFKEFFLTDCIIDNSKIADECKISIEDVLRIKELVNSVYIAEELQPQNKILPEKYYSCVASIIIKNKRPEIGFFSRDIWRNLYVIDELKLEKLKSFLKPKEKQRLKGIISKIKLIELRKTSLYRLLEFIISYQKKYFLTGNFMDLKPISQKEISQKLKIEKSVLSRMLSNKSIILPWQTEVKIKDLIPNKKQISKERVYILINKYPNLSDVEISKKLLQKYKIKLSRRTINQYRNELKRNKKI